MNTHQDIGLKDDFELLDIMLADSKSQPPVYRPGPYWAGKAKTAAKEIKRRGIADFRGSTNPIGLVYTDHLLIDIRNLLNYSRKLDYFEAAGLLNSSRKDLFLDPPVNCLPDCNSGSVKGRGLWHIR